ncbi:MAG: hypothetical protein ACRDSR_27590 [Pseudonocardiaceae bacterium]
MPGRRHLGLAVLVGGHPLAALLLFGCMFLTLYSVRSQALMAFWITAVPTRCWPQPSTGSSAGPDTPPVQVAREMDNALDTLRQRAKPLDNRCRSGAAGQATSGC